MKNLLRAGALALALLPGALRAAAPTSPQVLNAGGASVPTILVQEGYALATANVAAQPVTVIGGTYIFAQICSTYGTAAFQALGPDNSTWETIASKTSVDTAGGTAVQLQGSATVRASLSGTAGCAVTLNRVP